MISKFVWTVFIFFFSVTVLSAQVLWEGKQHDPDHLVNQVLDYIRKDSVQKSIDLSKTVLASYPDYTDFTYLLGLSHTKLGDPIQAEYYYRKTIEEQPTYYDAYYGLALSLWQQGKPNEADHIWTILPDSIAHIEYVQQLHADFLTVTKEEREIMDIERIKMEVATSTPSTALARLDSLLENHPDRLDLLQWKGVLLVENRQYADADEVFKKLIAKEYHTEQNLLARANVYATDRDFDRAYAVMDTLVLLYPNESRYQRLKTVYDDNRTYKNYILLEQGFLSYDSPVGTFMMSGLTYSTRIHPAVSIAGQVNWANLRNGKGFQYGLESWMNYTKSLYAYNSIGFSDSYAFPRWRIAYSLYRETKDWLLDIGFRYMYPQTGMDNLTGVFSLGKYLGPNFLYLRSFITYDRERIETAFAASWRYYYNENKPETFFTIIGNIGTSPDDPDRYLFYNDPSIFKSYAVTIGIQHRIGCYVVGSYGTWSSFKINDRDYFNQYHLNLSLKRYF